MGRDTLLHFKASGKMELQMESVGVLTTMILSEKLDWKGNGKMVKVMGSLSPIMNIVDNSMKWQMENSMEDIGASGMKANA